MIPFQCGRGLVIRRFDNCQGGAVVSLGAMLAMAAHPRKPLGVTLTVPRIGTQTTSGSDSSL